MSIYESLRTAMTGLTTNKMRAALTMLGIIIGVASVVALLSIGEGVEAIDHRRDRGPGLQPDLCHGPTSPRMRRRRPISPPPTPRPWPIPSMHRPLVDVAPTMQGQLRVDPRRRRQPA